MNILGSLEHAFTLDADGEAWAAPTLAAPGTSWERGEAPVVFLEVDGRRRQALVVAGGADPTEYLRCLGRLTRGPHALRFHLDPRSSVPPAGGVELLNLRTGSVADTDPTAKIWASAPILHYREDAGSPEGIATDTPLLLFYRAAAPSSTRGAPQLALEYHVIFSHEDAGTDLTGLLAKWGHTTDIEWIYRIECDGAGAIVGEVYQGRGHRALPFRGTRAWGAHPVLQVTGKHGMVTDRVDGARRVALAPALRQPDDEPREGVQQRFPWIYRVSALEVLRQVVLERTPEPSSPSPADLRAYLFLQWKRGADASAPLEAGVLIGGRWYTSAWGRPDLAFCGADAESTAIKLPPGTVDSAVEAIAVRTAAPSRVPIPVTLVRAFRLDDRYLPGTPLAASGTIRLTEPNAWGIAWDRRSGHRYDGGRRLTAAPARITHADAA